MTKLSLFQLFHRSSFASIKSNAKLSKLAIVILAGDCMNNFMDGISIGAGYSYHLSTGIKLSTAIAFEEYTHKLGKVTLSRLFFLHRCHSVR